MSGGDPNCVGDRSGGWEHCLPGYFRQELRDHLRLISPSINLRDRTIEMAEDELVDFFVNVATSHIDGFLAGRPPREVCGRLLGKDGEARSALHGLLRPLVKRIAGSKDPFERAEWKCLRRIIFLGSSTAKDSSDDEGDADGDGEIMADVGAPDIKEPRVKNPATASKVRGFPIGEGLSRSARRMRTKYQQRANGAFGDFDGVTIDEIGRRQEVKNVKSTTTPRRKPSGSKQSTKPVPRGQDRPKGNEKNTKKESTPKQKGTLPRKRK